MRATDGWTAPREIRLTALQPLLPERLIDYIESVSWMAALPADQRAETLARIAAIVSAGETPAELPVHAVIGLACLA